MTVRLCIHHADDEEEIKKTVVRKHGWRTLREEGLRLVVEQERSTLEEVLRVTHAETESPNAGRKRDLS